MPYREFLQILTNFGDQGLVLPFVLSIGIMLWVSHAKREARIWVLATGAALGAMLLLKLAFLPCGHLLPGWQLRSPSGHAASAFVAYGGFAVLEAKLRTRRWQSLTILATGFIIACVIAATRLALNAHTLPEVLLGSLVGLSAPVILLWKIRPISRHAGPQAAARANSADGPAARAERKDPARRRLYRHDCRTSGSGTGYLRLKSG